MALHICRYTPVLLIAPLATIIVQNSLHHQLLGRTWAVAALRDARDLDESACLRTPEGYPGDTANGMEDSEEVEPLQSTSTVGAKVAPQAPPLPLQPQLPFIKSGAPAAAPPLSQLHQPTTEALAAGAQPSQAAASAQLPLPGAPEPKLEAAAAAPSETVGEMSWCWGETGAYYTPPGVECRLPYILHASISFLSVTSWRGCST